MHTCKRKRNMTTTQDESVCSICLEGDAEMGFLTSMCCGRTFHKSCIEKWLSVRQTCPDCRRANVNIANYKGACPKSYVVPTPPTGFAAETVTPSAPPMPRPRYAKTVPRTTMALTMRNLRSSNATGLPLFFETLYNNKQVQLYHTGFIQRKNMAGALSETDTEFVALPESELARLEDVTQDAERILRCLLNLPKRLERMGIEGEPVDSNLVAVSRNALCTHMYELKNCIRTMKLVRIKPSWLSV